MPEPFKNFFNPNLIKLMGRNLSRANSNFEENRFVERATDGLDQLELKERSNQITLALEKTLGDNFVVACRTLVDALHPVEDAHLGDLEISDDGIRGWAIMPMGEYIARQGMNDVEQSLEVLGHFTKRFSAEFAIRPFFINAPETTLEKALQWSKDNNFHLRRLASEGSRPRLPWGLRLHEYVLSPAPLLPILDNLKDDSEEYVRRSVANNLNDIAKDHPDLVASIAAKWMKNAGTNRQRLVKHACRSLIKSGHQPTLEALGYGAPEIELTQFQLTSNMINLGESLEFGIEIQSSSTSDQPLIVDFVIHHLKASGETSPKTFKWRNIDLKTGELVKLKKKHPMKPITTRTYYAGEHLLEIQINGTSFGKLPFELNL